MLLFLIGLPGSGKSTLGRLLANRLRVGFVDTDLLISQRCGTSLQTYLDNFGPTALRALEEEVLLESDFSNQVVATGGSVVYSEAGMARIAALGSLVYLKISLETMLKRVKNQEKRGLACEKGTSLEQIFYERCPLYDRFSSAEISIDGLDQLQSLEKLLLNLPNIQAKNLS